MGAAMVMGKDAAEGNSPPDRDLTARIQLEPTPGVRQIRVRQGVYRGEVLTSGPYSNAYVTESNWVPITKYFRILRKTKCDSEMWVTLVTPQMIRNNPQHVSGISRDQDPSYGCEKEFHQRFNKGGDPDLADADGVIIDPLSFKDKGHQGLFVNQLHVYFDAWAIKFDEPTKADIVKALTNRAYLSAYIVQQRAVAYWIEKHQATEFIPLMKAALPIAGSSDMAFGWDTGRLAILKAIAMLPGGDDPKLYLDIIRGSKTSQASADPNNPLPVPADRNDHVNVAANALACSPSLMDYLPEIRSIAENSGTLPSKLVAAGLLHDLGHDLVVDRLANRIHGRSQILFYELSHSKAKVFQCPYKATYG